MKKFVKGLAVVSASAVLCAGIGVMAGCSATDGTYVGEYHYISAYGPTYGMVVEVTVKDNMITKVRDLTNSDDERAVKLQTYADKVYDGTMTEEAYHEWHEVSDGWDDYYKANSWLWTEGDTENVTVENGTVEYTIVTKDTLTVDGATGQWRPGAFTFKIAVDGNKKITKYEIVTNGSAPESYAGRMPKSFQNGTWFVGKSLADLKTAYGDDLTFTGVQAGLTSNELATGATQSDYICVQAAAYALANHDAYVNVYLNGGAASGLQYRDVVQTATVDAVYGAKVPSNPIPDPKDTAIGSYAWTNETAANWTTHLSWLLQQYVGLSVKEVLDMNVYTNFGYMIGPKQGWSQTYLEDKDSMGEPYGKDFNADLNDAGLLVTGSTQGSGRLALAIQNALKK